MLMSLALLLLASFSEAVTFPMGNCYVRGCDASPYKLTPTVNNATSFCFRIDPAQCVDSSKYNCCGLLNNNFNKIVMLSQPACKSSLSKVTVNNIVKGGGVYFDIYDTDKAELRLTNLQLTSQSAYGVEMCLVLKPPCSTIDTFCSDGINKTCMYSIFDPATHTCCPTCQFQTALGTQPTDDPHTVIDFSPPVPEYVYIPLYHSPHPPTPPPPQYKTSTTNCTCTCNF